MLKLPAMQTEQMVWGQAPVIPVLVTVLCHRVLMLMMMMITCSILVAKQKNLQVSEQ